MDTLIFNTRSAIEVNEIPKHLTLSDLGMHTCVTTHSLESICPNCIQNINCLIFCSTCYFFNRYSPVYGITEYIRSCYVLCVSGSFGVVTITD